jgi:hypothetical protein
MLACSHQSSKHSTPSTSIWQRGQPAASVELEGLVLAGWIANQIDPDMAKVGANECMLLSEYALVFKIVRRVDFSDSDGVKQGLSTDSQS